MTENGFVQWLDEELARRNWRPADLARAAGISTGSLSQIYSGTRNAGPDIANAIARGLNLPPDTVFRHAGLLPESPGPAVDSILQELDEILRNMTHDQRRDVADYALWRFQRRDGGT